MKKNIKELISYIVVGGCTTIINFIIYWMIIKIYHQGWLLSNIISWIGAVIFAFFANRCFVFKSENSSGREAVQFFVLRLGTLVIESILLLIFIQLLGVNEMFSKVVVSVITVISNYGFCKFRIFAVNGGHEYE